MAKAPEQDTAKGVDAPKRDMAKAPKVEKAKDTWTSNPNVSDPAPVPVAPEDQK